VVLGRKRRKKQHRRGRHALPDDAEPMYGRQTLPAEEEDEELVPEEGPYDVEVAPEDDIPRMDLGSVRIPVPDNCQVQVEMDQESGHVRAVHVVTPHGQVTISAYAAPKSSGIWSEVCTELAEQLRSDGAIVRTLTGDWGKELSAKMGDMALHFIGVDGPRWMLRGVIASPKHVAEGAPAQLRALMKETVVVRGSGPMPVRTPLPIKLPPAMAEAIAQQRGQA
jgi:hypothetical protein